MSFYTLEVVGGKGVANVFYREFEQRQKASVPEGIHVDFRFHDVVIFLLESCD